MAKCKCGNRTRIVSSVVQSINQSNNKYYSIGNNGCVDVCAHPIYGTPNNLSLYAPLIYDEVGVNLCTTFDVGAVIPTAYPTATCASIEVVDINFTYGDGEVEIEGITGRPNCYLITLTDLAITFAVHLYDSTCRLLGTVYPTAVYLPSSTAAITYDADTNPTSAELEIFAPYGTAFTSTGTDPIVITESLNVITMLTGSNSITQGINLYAIPKVLAFDSDDSTITVGITLVLQSLYFAGYRVATSGKIQIPKGSINSTAESSCLQFVCGDLLNLAIKPLELNTTVPAPDSIGCGCPVNGCGCGCSVSG